MRDLPGTVGSSLGLLFRTGPMAAFAPLQIVPPRRVKTREDALPLCILVRGSGIKRSRDGAKDIGVDELLPDPTIASLVQIDRLADASL